MRLPIPYKGFQQNNAQNSTFYKSSFLFATQNNLNKFYFFDIINSRINKNLTEKNK